MLNTLRSFALTALLIGALAFITGIALSLFAYTNNPPTWFQPGSWPWLLATLTITATWYALHTGALRCVVPTLRRLARRFGRSFSMALIALSVTVSTGELAIAEEKKRPLLDALKSLNEGLKNATEKGNEVKDALDHGVVPVLTNVQHQVYKAPFATSRGTVYVYRAPLCGPCDDAVEYLKEARIKHRIRNVKTSTLAKRQFERLEGSGVPILIFIGRRMDGFSVADFECAIETPKGHEAECEFQELAEDDDTLTREEPAT